MRLTSGAVTLQEVLCCLAACVMGLVIPSLPRWAGSTIRSLMVSLKRLWPVRPGRKRCR